MAKASKAACSAVSLNSKKAKKRFKASRDIPRYLFVLPALLLVIVFCYGPMYGLLMAFQDFSPFKGIAGSDWVGLKHFKYFLTGPSSKTFWQVVGNTLEINFLQLLVGTPTPLIFALMLNEVKNPLFKKTVQTVSYLPYFISWVVVASLVSTLLSPEGGIVNTVLHNLFGIEPIYFLAKNQYFQPIVVIANTWKGFGMASVYYLAALTGIDPQLYEAAEIDGAGKFKQIIHITLPGIAPTFVLLLIMNVGSILSIGFENIFLLYSPLVYDVGDVLSTYTYRLGIESTQYSLTTAVGIAQSVVNFIMVISANKISQRVVGYGMW